MEYEWCAGGHNKQCLSMLRLHWPASVVVYVIIFGQFSDCYDMWFNSRCARKLLWANNIRKRRCVAWTPGDHFNAWLKSICVFQTYRLRCIVTHGKLERKTEKSCFHHYSSARFENTPLFSFRSPSVIRETIIVPGKLFYSFHRPSTLLIRVLTLFLTTCTTDGADWTTSTI